MTPRDRAVEQLAELLFTVRYAMKPPWSQAPGPARDGYLKIARESLDRIGLVAIDGARIDDVREAANSDRREYIAALERFRDDILAQLGAKP